MKEPEKEEEKKEKKKKKKIKQSIDELKDDVKDFFSPFEGLFGEKHEFAEKEIKKIAQEKAESLSFVLYDVYKKAHGMMSW